MSVGWVPVQASYRFAETAGAADYSHHSPAGDAGRGPEERARYCYHHLVKKERICQNSF